VVVHTHDSSAILNSSEGYLGSQGAGRHIIIAKVLAAHQHLDRRVHSDAQIGRCHDIGAPSFDPKDGSVDVPDVFERAPLSLADGNRCWYPVIWLVGVDGDETGGSCGGAYQGEEGRLV